VAANADPVILGARLLTAICTPARDMNLLKIFLPPL